MIIAGLIAYYLFAFLLLFAVAYHALRQNIRDANRMYEEWHAHLMELMEKELSAPRLAPTDPPVESLTPAIEPTSNGAVHDPATTPASPRED